MGEFFGTDGVRGIPGQYPLDGGTLARLTEAVAWVMARAGHRANGHPPAVLMCRDTRQSGPALCRSLVAGFRAAGWRTLDLGVAPTPAVSYLTPRLNAACGMIVSASHNPAQFNGIKFVDARGFKIDASIESAIERRLKASGAATRRLPGFQAVDVSANRESYLEFLRSTFPPTLDLSGMKIIVDCANGAASSMAPGLFKALGAEVVSMADDPDGSNINRGCGALHPRKMSELVTRRGAHCGVSFDGDADRAIFADEKGRLLDGDSLLCLSALRLQGQGLLRENRVVLTVMSNFGLIRFLRERGMDVVTVPVGDRHVTEAIEKGRLSLGGEASGHLVFRSFAVTGDGMLTALQTLAALRESGGRLSAVRNLYRATPQIIENVEVAERVPLEQLKRLSALVRLHERSLGNSGRIILRYSGTEPLLRVMVEGPRDRILRRMVKDIVRVYQEETGVS